MKYTMLKKLKKLLAIAFACTSAFGFAGCADLLNSIASAVTDAIENQVFEDGTVDENYVYTRTEGGGSYYYERLTPEQQKFYIKVRIDMDKFFAGERELKKYTYEKEEYRVLGHYRYATFDLTKDAALQAFDAFYQDCPQYYAYDVMNNWGANHGAISYGHIGADIITLCSMLRIPVCMHNVDEDKIYRPAAWNAFGMDKEGQDYRACQAYGPMYKNIK